MYLFRNAFTLLLSVLIVISSSSRSVAIEMPTDEVMQSCRSALQAERGAMLVERWSNKPLRSEYRRAFGHWLRGQTVEIWAVHRNPNGSSTIVARTLSHDPEERGFLLLVKDGDRIVNIEGVSAFEFAFSRFDSSGVKGLFFCDKHGPSAEWRWSGKEWVVEPTPWPTVKEN